jgi:hypothetical protein
MKKITLLMLTGIFTAAFAIAQAPHVPAKKGTQFGEKIKADDAVSPDMLPELLKEKETVDVKVKGRVLDVCSARGCFFYLKTTTGKIYIKTKDDTFFVPLALHGKTVVVQGTASRDKDSKEISIQAKGVVVI